DWMIHRMDPPQDAAREPMPERLEPMLARTGPLPPDDGRWAFEIKWDGVRAIAFASGGRVRLASRLGREITPRYPELRELGPALAGLGQGQERAPHRRGDRRLAPGRGRPRRAAWRARRGLHGGRAAALRRTGGHGVRRARAGAHRRAARPAPARGQPVLRPPA